MTGYAWIYGISLIVGSYPVLFVSLAAHSAQFAFLVFFENPRKYRGVLNFTFVDSDLLALDIERFYGQPKLLAQRVPIPQPSPANCSANGVPQVRSSLQGQGEMLARARAFSDPLSTSTSSATEGPTACDSETETDAELDSQQMCISEELGSANLSHHDLRNRYFRKDTIVLSHLDVFRYASCTRGSVFWGAKSFFIRQGSRLHATSRNGICFANRSPSDASAHERGVAFWARACLDSLPHTLPRSGFTRTEHAQVPRATLLKALSLPAPRLEA